MFSFKKDPKKNFQTPKRPEIGNVGHKIALQANHFDVKITRNIVLHHYNINVQPDNVPRFLNRQIFNQLIEKYKYIFEHIKFVYDGKCNLYTNKVLPIGSNNNHCFQMEIDFTEHGKPHQYRVSIKWICEISLNNLENALKGYGAEIPQDAVIAIDIILRYLPSLTYRSIGRNFFSSSTNEKQYPLGSGREIWFGYHQSVKPADWKLLLNMDVSATAFYKSQSVFEFMCEILNINNEQMNNNFGFSLNDVQRQKFVKEIRNLKIEITDERLIKRKYRVISITRKSVNSQTFPLQIGIDDSSESVECTVANYFNDKYNIKLNYSNLQCLQVGKEVKHTYIPMELCKIVAGQRCLKKLTDLQTSAMIKATAKSAPEREHEINNLIQKFDFNNNEYVQEFGLKISQNMLKINGRILPTPKLQYGGVSSLPNNNNNNSEPSMSGDNRTNLAYPKYGVWDMRGKQFFIGIELNDWAIISFAPQCDLPNDKLHNFIVYLRKISNDAGMKITQNPCTIKFISTTSSSNIESILIEFKQMIKPLQLFMIILPGKSSIYADIKRIGDTVLGIVTQCIQIKNVLHTNPQTLSNVCLKINVKLGGVNSILLPTIRSKVFEKPIIFLGADLTHPPINDYRRPSIAAVVGSMDAHPSRYAATIRIQPIQQIQSQSNIPYNHQQHQQQFIQRDDVISDLTNMVKEMLLMFYKTTGFKPHRIVMYRNAGSNEKFTNLLCNELVAIRKACLQLDLNYRPGITYIIVQKRHHTRLFCNKSKDRTSRSGNIPAGTCVDVSITNPKDFDFYLCSHQGIQGTSRPSYYNVLWDDNNFNSDELQCLTYQLCHTYARCTRSVSIPAPIYYAHLCAFRARYHLVEAERNNDCSNPNITKDRLYQIMNDTIKIHSDIQNAMYFA